MCEYFGISSGGSGSLLYVFLTSPFIYCSCDDPQGREGSPLVWNLPRSRIYSSSLGVLWRTIMLGVERAHLCVYVQLCSRPASFYTKTILCKKLWGINPRRNQLALSGLAFKESYLMLIRMYVCMYTGVYCPAIRYWG